MKVNKYITTTVEVDTDVDVEFDADDVINFIGDSRTTNSQLEDILETLTEAMKGRGLTVPEIMPPDLPDHPTLYDKMKIEHLKKVSKTYSLEQIEKTLPIN